MSSYQLHCTLNVNSFCTQKIEEMRITIEDLEALKELNDELEENHMETEKALLGDLGALLLVPRFFFLNILGA